MVKSKTIVGFKGFDESWKCRDKQYVVGKSYTHVGKVKLCEQGFHFVENPLDIFDYYPPTSKFAEVEASGVSAEESSDSKLVAKKLKITAEISLHNLVDAGVKFTLSKIDFYKAKESNTGDRSAATNTGYQSAATNTGYRSAATNTGKEGMAIATGVEGKASGAKGCWLTLAEWEQDANYDWHIKDMQSVKVDGKKIKAEVFYSLVGGEFVEA